MELPKQSADQPKRRSKIIESKPKVSISKPSGVEAKTSTPSLDLNDSLFLAVVNAESKAQYVVAGRKIKSFDQIQTLKTG